MNFQIVQEKDFWDKLVQSQPEYTFLHSWNWGNFLESSGNKIWRLGLVRNRGVKKVVLITKVKAKRGAFIFSPHILHYWFNLNDFLLLLEYLKKLAQQEKCSFIRLSPLSIRNEKNEQFLKRFRFRRAPLHMHAESTLLLDLSQPEDEIFKKMKKNTRNLIRRAQKEGVVIKETLDPTNFLRLQKEVVGRKHFVPFSREYLEKEIQSFLSDQQIKIFEAEYQNEIIATAIIIFYGYRAFYYQAASSSKFQKIPAPYLIQWQAILEAKKRGCQLYDFYGASPENQPNHPWSGPTFFKKSFGSYRVDYLPAHDLILSPLYYKTWLIETIRRKKRGF